ncbi:hypothetical protein KMP13_02360 [Epibacterium ulvae]|uniref:peptidase G2 autoproteolytic cleavage domain-containing protein n=1 Tax=Epibacterium ulvae TaxID=1156985 RepID=UPI001BFC7AE7|nr:peptidase G2 autoproteolytic cleavage domain-containing protein [Epibacterium ulvae]MBT8152757.1 hypothetical protein [Epibacterium ulvae]
MPFNASGVFQRLFNWRTDRDNNVNIRADRMDQEFDGIAAAINDILSGSVGFRAPVRGVFGTEALPAYSFTDDPDTGFYRKSENAVAFAVGGQDVFYLTPDGVGIGTQAPLTDLHVHQGGGGSTRVRVENGEGHADFIADFARARIIANDGGGAADFYSYGRVDVSGDATNNNHKLGVFCSNLNYNNDTFRLVHGRPATSGFSFFRCISNDAVSPDVEIIGRGNGDLAMDGNVSSGGADYAEFFEWADGNPEGDDRRGVSVVLVEDKIRPAEEGEVPFGVISANPSVVGDADIDRWMYKYLRDDFGSPILEDYEIVEWEATDGETGEVEHYQFVADALPDGTAVPEDAKRTVAKRRVLNPEWGPNREYTPRRDRAEWDCAGLMGKLRLRKGQPVAPGWIKMKDVSETVEMWLVK